MISILYLFISRTYIMHFLLLAQGPGMDDPGTPGGDPDVPETPLDSGIYILIIIALIYGVWRIRRLETKTE